MERQQEPPIEEVLNNTEKYKEEWSKYESKILKGMTTCIGLDFKRNYIDVFVVSGNPRPFSRPIVIKSRYPIDEFICVISHELIHCLFADNMFSKNGRDPYPKNSHIVVHPILKYLYIDVLREPKLLDVNKEAYANSNNKKYDGAWKKVDELGYMEILNKVKGSI